MNRIQLTNPHSLTVQETLEHLLSEKEGLSTSAARERLEAYGPNELPEVESASILLLLLKQFKSWLVILLIAAAAISAFAGQWVDTWVIIVVVLINAGVGFSQEFRAGKAISSLRKMIVKTAKVYRDGKLMVVPSAQLVPGDVIVLEEGDSIAADARIVMAQNFRTMEASLTGESLPVAKTTGVLNEDTALADRNNMVWKGTFAAGGFAKAMVSGTGVNTALGDVSEMLKNVAPKRSNFLKKTDILAKQMSIIAVASASLIFITGYFFRNFELQEILLTSIAALVAAIPEGLPAVVSIVLAVGANRMAKRNAIIREFTATETLGAVSAILTDKTGTLTQNSLTIRKIFTSDTDEFTVTGEGWSPIGNVVQAHRLIDIEAHPVLEQLLKIAAVSNNSKINHTKKAEHYELIGDPTEGALLVLAKKGGIQADPFEPFKRDDLPFDSAMKLRATLLEEKGLLSLHVIGAPEKILERASHLLRPEGVVTLEAKDRDILRQKIAEWSKDAMRVIALAYKIQKDDSINTEAIDELVFVGIVGMIDPPRPDSRAAVNTCKKAGIRVIMVTGDHVNTAVAVARTTGIIADEDSDAILALTEQQLEQLDDDEFDSALRSISVFARLTPKMKLKIAGRLQAMGHLIAMTGDGVNDAPALKQADVGISMGIMGTDVARDSSDVVLADDNFSTIVKAIEEGRIVFTNSRQTSFFLITTNIAESVTLLLSIGLGLPLPLTATQILWLNLVTDGITDMALAMEPGHGEIMQKRPLLNQNILNREVLPFLLINVCLMTVLALGAFLFYLDESTEKARTAAFVVMAFTQLFNVFNLRSIHLSIFSIGVFSNKYINLAVGVSVLLLVLITEIPVLASLFHFESLQTLEFIVLFALSSCILWAGELYKYFRRTAYAKQSPLQHLTP